MYPQSCFLCGAQVETNMHLLQCKHNDQVLNHTHLALDILSLREKLKSDRHLQTLLHVGIFEGTYDKNYRPRLAYEHPSLHTIIDHQNAIGWDHVIQGRITKSMVHHQDQYYRSKGLYDGKLYTGKRWATKLIRLLWKSVLAAWKTRNDIVHGHDRIERQRNASRIYERRVHACYEFLPHLCGNDRHMFDDSASITLAKPPHQLATWLTMVETLIQQAKKEQSRRNRDEYFKKLYRQPSYNPHVREAFKKPTKVQDIRKFMQPRNIDNTKSH